MCYLYTALYTSARIEDCPSSVPHVPDIHDLSRGHLPYVNILCRLWQVEGVKRHRIEPSLNLLSLLIRFVNPMSALQAANKVGGERYRKFSWMRAHRQAFPGRLWASEFETNLAGNWILSSKYRYGRSKRTGGHLTLTVGLCGVFVWRGLVYKTQETVPFMCLLCKKCVCHGPCRPTRGHAMCRNKNKTTLRSNLVVIIAPCWLGNYFIFLHVWTTVLMKLWKCSWMGSVIANLVIFPSWCRNMSQSMLVDISIE